MREPSGRSARTSPGDPEKWLENFVFDVLVHDPEVLEMLVKRVGAANLVMGTDAPFDMASPHPVRDLLSVVDEGTAREIMEETPARLFGLNSAPGASEATGEWR
jgi:hypothetical protein